WSSDVCSSDLDAIVVVGIVRGTDDDAGIGLERPRQIGDGRRGHGPEQLHVSPGCRQPRLQGGFEHVARDTGVLADQNAAFALLAKRHPRRPAELEHEVRSDGKLADTPTDTIGAEILSSHTTNLCYCAASTAAIMRTTSTVSATSCTRRICAPLATA